MHYRLVQAKWAVGAMSGMGARISGGRWNPVGQLAVYLAASRALAALEVLVHAPRELLALEWRVFEVEVPDACIRNVAASDLPADWRVLPSSSAAQRFGAEWLRGMSSVAMRLPSALIPEESILLLNPLHPDMDRIQVSPAKKFGFDARLVKI